MADQINNGGPAYPIHPDYAPEVSPERVGMSLRDHFAGLALAALIGHEDKDYTNRGKSAVPTLARFAYEYADEMLRARAS